MSRFNRYLKNNLLHHLIELRKRLLLCLSVVGACFLAFYPYSSEIFHRFALPLLNQMTGNHQLIATTLTGAFFGPIKLCLLLAFFISMPVILYQMWKFVAPGLYKKERLVAGILLISSILLFYLGVIFAYAIIFPTIMAFLVHIAPEGVTVTPDISAYLHFSFRLLAAFGIAFEIPAFMFFLVHTKLVSLESIRQKRRYIIVTNFIIGMLLTPDVISQLSLALPMCLLFEIGLLTAQWKPQTL